jgi:SAM-dependent methyltransferase
MGIRTDYLEYALDCIRSSVGELSGKKMLELGDQMFVKGEPYEKSGKEYFENRGVLHTSVDLNGRHGALKIDLSKPIEVPHWKNHFDIVTNFGTLEHVEPKKAQYECFRNVHYCLKPGGIAIHLLPDIDELIKSGAWKNHCNNYYSRDFVNTLVNNNDYELLSLKMINGLICPCYRKKSDSIFTQNRKELLRQIVRKKGGAVYVDINESAAHKIFRLSHQLPRRIAGRIYHALGIKALMDRRKV